MKKIVFLIFITVLFYSCNSGDSVSPPNTTTPANYNKINTIESGNMKFEIWSATGQNFCFGYNDFGFKVFINGVEKKTGFTEFRALMYHEVNGPSHSSPISNKFYYDNNKNLYIGYACFTMLSDSSSNWYGYFNYNNEVNLDSIPFNVIYVSTGQLKAWDDYMGGYSYILTLISPTSPGLGLNDFTCMLHRTTDEKYYSEVDSAEMFIRPWMPSHVHGSSNNVDPVRTGSGKYEGKVNFTMPGNWEVYDSIKINNVFITPTPPPKFSLIVQ